MSHLSSDRSCVFCKIVRNEIPSAKVLETAEIIAFMDISPVNQGHILVLPKEHAVSLAELSAGASARVGEVLPDLCNAVRLATNADGFNVIVNGGRVAGQTVDHCHFHIIPRFHGDPVHWPWPHTAYEGDGLSQMQVRILSELDRAARHDQKA